MGYDALAVTNHNAVCHSPELESYAARKGLLLLPGVELTLSGRHVLLIGPGLADGPLPLSLDDLRSRRPEEVLTIAPHPFFRGFKSLREKLLPYLDVFDGIEYSAYYCGAFNENRKAEVLAAGHGLPLIGSSDCHNLWQFGTTWTEVEAAKTPRAIIAAVKESKIVIRTTPMAWTAVVRVAVNFLLVDRLGLPFRI